MKQGILGKILGIILILIAIWYFDWNKWNPIIVSTVLFLSGLNSLFRDSESDFLRKLSRILLYVGLFIAIFLIFKVLLVG